MRLINTRSDLDAIAGTPEFDAFIAVLKGSIYRLEKDDVAKLWTLVTDTSTIEKYDFTLADFADVVPPDVPVYVTPPVVVPQAVPLRAAKFILLQAGKLSVVNTAIANMPGVEGEAARIDWAHAQEVRRDNALVLSLIPLLGMTDSEIDNLFIQAAAL